MTGFQLLDNELCKDCLTELGQLCGNCECYNKYVEFSECAQCHTALCINCVNTGENVCQECLIEFEKYYKNFEIEVYNCNICKYTSQLEDHFNYCELCNRQHCLYCSDTFYAICSNCSVQQGDCVIELQNLKIR